MIARLWLALAAMLALAPAAHAATYTYGSDLSRPVTTSDSHPQDWAAFPTATTPPSPGGYAVTQAGEVSAVAFRGRILADSPVPALFVFRIVVLRPQADGSLSPTVASADLKSRFIGADQQAVTSVDLQALPERMCVVPGDVVAVATSGGYDPQTYPRGVPVQMFSSAPASSYGVYKKAATDPSFQNGTKVRPTTVTGKELLMRVTVGTGDNARPTCRVATSTTTSPSPTPSATPGPTPASGAVAISAKTVKVRRGKVRLSLGCAGPGACTGTLALSRLGRNYGRAPFSIAAGARGIVTVKLTGAGRRGKGRVTVKAQATLADGRRITQRIKISR